MTIDYLIVAASVLVTLIIGWYAGRGIKDIREYAIANQMYGTEALTLTLLATIVGGNVVINGPNSVSSVGIIASVAYCGVFVRFIFTALCIAPNMKYFKGCLTMGDAAEQLYGASAKVLAGVLSLLYAICVIGMQLLALAVICQMLHIPASWSIGVGGILLALYTAHGGMKAVTLTDVFQFIVLFVGFTLIAHLTLDAVGGPKALFSQLPAEKLQIVEQEEFFYYLTVFFIMSVFPTNVIDSAHFQRLLMARDGRQLRRAYLITATFYPIFLTFTTALGLVGLVMYSDLEGIQIVPHLIDTLLPTGVKGIAIAGTLAVVISTADSYLHVAGLTMVHDIIHPICKKQNVEIDELKWARYGTLMVGCLAAVVAWYVQGENIVAQTFAKLNLLALQLAAPILMFPLIAGIMGLRTEKSHFYAATVTTFIAFLAAQVLLPAQQRHLAALIGILTNFVTFFSMHLVQHGGIAIVDRSNGDNTFTVLKPRRESLLKQIGQCLPTPSNILKYSQQRVARYGSPYVLFGIFFSLNITIPYFMWTEVPAGMESFTIYFRLIGATACCLFIVVGSWPKGLKPYAPLLWYITLLYCIPFTNTFMFLLTQGSDVWLKSISASIVLLIMLTNLTTFTILTALGIFLGFSFHRLIIGPVDFQPNFDTWYTIGYENIYYVILGVVFSYIREVQLNSLSNQNRILTLTDQENKADILKAFQEKMGILSGLQYAGIKDLLQVVKFSRSMYVEAKEKNNDTLLKHSLQMQSTLIPIAVGLRGIRDRAARYMRLTVDQHPIHQILHQVHETLKDKALHKDVTYQIRTKCEALWCDAQEIQKLLVNAIALMRKDYPEHPILVMVEDTELHYPLSSFKNSYTKKLAALRFTITSRESFSKPQASYLALINQEPIYSSQSTYGLTLTKNELITMAHYGCAQQACKSVLCYVVPIQLREVRSKDQDQTYMDVAARPVRADDRYKGAQEQEAAFLKDVEERTNANVEMVKIVLELIKWYHGPVKRKSGEPFYLHPVAVAHIVMDYNTDEATIMGALMHDMVEDTSMLLEDVKAAFGSDTAEIVRTVTHLEGHEDRCYKIKLSAQESLDMLEKAGDKRALYVKIADRLHNMRTIKAKRQESQIRTAKETLIFFVPLAERIGLKDAAKELMQLCAEVLNAVGITTRTS